MVYDIVLITLYSILIDIFGHVWIYLNMGHSTHGKKQMAMLTEKTNHGVAEGTGIHKQTQVKDRYPLIN
jgi:hypothetical protein